MFLPVKRFTYITNKNVKTSEKNTIRLEDIDPSLSEKREEKNDCFIQLILASYEILSYAFFWEKIFQ